MICLFTRSPAAAKVALFAFLCGAPLTLSAQLVRGIVADDSTGTVIADATVTLLDAGGVAADTVARTRTDTLGRFTLAARSAGRFRVRVNRIGYREAVSEEFQVNSGSGVEIRVAMSAVPQRLGAVEVSAQRRLPLSELLTTAGFDLRRARGLGLFIDTAQLADQKRQPIADVLVNYAAIPHMVMQRIRYVDRFLIQRGQLLCEPEVWLDGVFHPPWRAYSLLNSLGADELFGVEVYNATNMPPPSLGAEFGLPTAMSPGGEFWRSQPMRGPCGVVAIWTRRFHDRR